MARTRTLAEMRTEAQQRANMENSTFIATTEWNRMINESISDLWDLLLDTTGQEYYERQDDQDLIPGTDYYLLPATFYRLLGVSVTCDGDTYPLRPFNHDERHNENMPLRYRLTGDVSDSTGAYTPVLYLRPMPTVSGTLSVFYVPHAPVLNADTDVWDGFNGWEEYVIVDVAIKALEKEESDTTALQHRLARLTKRIQGLAPSRDQSFPERVRDVADEY